MKKQTKKTTKVTKEFDSKVNALINYINGKVKPIGSGLSSQLNGRI